MKRVAKYEIKPPSSKDGKNKDQKQVHSSPAEGSSDYSVSTFSNAASRRHSGAGDVSIPGIKPLP